MRISGSTARVVSTCVPRAATATRLLKRVLGVSRAPRALNILCTHSRWKAAPECKQQLGRPLNANLPAEQRPHEIGFLAQETQPGLGIGSKSQIGLSIVAFAN